MQRLASDELLSNLPLECRAVGPVLRHGFHTPEAQQGGSIQTPNLSTRRGALHIGVGIQSELTRVVDYRCRVEFDNAAIVDSADLIFGDLGGVLGVPAAHVDDVIQAATAKVQGEDRVRAMLGRSMTTEAIFAETGIM